MPDFSSRTRSRGLNRLQMGQQANAELSKDAFDLSDSTSKAADELLTHDLTNADMRPLRKSVSDQLSNYMENYKKDPYFAFSREGRATAKRIKDLLNHSDVKDLEEAHKDFKAEYARATTERLNKNFVVDGDSVLAIKDGRRQYVPLSELKTMNPDNGDRVLNVDSDAHVLKNVFGLRGGVPSYNMTSLEKVEKKIDETLSHAKLGDTESGGESAGGIGVTNTSKTKSNTNQLSAAIIGLMRGGLNTADQNTLKGEYIKEVGVNASNKDYKDWLLNRLQNYGSSQAVTSTLRGTKKAITGKGSGEGNDKTKELGVADLVLSGQYGTREQNAIDTNGFVSHDVANNLPPDTYNISSGTQKDKNGNLIPNRRMKNLGLATSGAMDVSTAVVQDKKTGAAVHVPGIENAVASSKKPPALVTKYTYNVNGKPTPVPEPAVVELKRYLNGDKAGEKIPAALRDYLSPDGKLQMKQWVSMYVLSNAPRGLQTGDTSTSDMLDKLGYEATNNDEAATEFDEFSGDGNDSHSGINDKKHEVHVLVELTSKPALRRMFGDKTFGSEDQTNVETGGLQDNYVQYSPSQYDPASIPNQVKKSNFVTLSATH